MPNGKSIAWTAAIALLVVLATERYKAMKS